MQPHPRRSQPAQTNHESFLEGLRPESMRNVQALACSLHVLRVVRSSVHGADRSLTEMLNSLRAVPFLIFLESTLQQAHNHLEANSVTELSSVPDIKVQVQACTGTGVKRCSSGAAYLPGWKA